MDPVEALGRLTSRLLSVDTVFSTVQRTLLSTLDARRKLDRNIERVLAGANLPSARDVERVAEQLGELDRELAQLTARVAALTAKLEAERAQVAEHVADHPEGDRSA
ncbi:hypothetical protein L6R52_34285 [Myxococcota bacterium]|nr:hypothetical protein [Myxococcota bacterium]